ncbi:MAG: helix-turn-helix domain-containing protein [Acutalibacteraceae bacterium]
MFFTVFESLCKQKGKSVTAVGNEIGISKTTISYWRNTDGVIPKQDVLVKIANYFGVSVDYLLGNTEQKENPAADSDETLMFALYGADNKDITPAMLEDVRIFAQYIREKRKGENK